ncbi:hypothetical protein Gotur_017930 [Gossypium turneri]
MKEYGVPDSWIKQLNVEVPISQDQEDVSSTALKGIIFLFKSWEETVDSSKH